MDFDKVYLHADLDAFFASAEQLRNPHLKGKPVIIGGLPTDRRAVVSTASYEARAFGVHSAMPMSKAAALCPQAVFLRPDHTYYSQLSSKVMDVLRQFSPCVTQLSIDEAMLDLTGTQRLWGNPFDCAQKIKQTVKNVTRLTISVGIATNMYTAKMAAGFQKPDGLTLVERGREEEFMLTLPLEKLFGVGEKSTLKLKAVGICTVCDVHQKSLGVLESILGKSAARFLYDAVRGGHNINLGGEARSHSVSAEKTFEYDLTSLWQAETELMALCHQVLWKMRSENLQSRTTLVKIRYDDFTTVTAQETSSLIMDESCLFERVKRLFTKKRQAGKAVRLLGVSAVNLFEQGGEVQGELFVQESSRQSLVEKAIFQMESKNPALKVTKARLILPNGSKNPS